MASDLEIAFKVLETKTKEYQTLWSYYDGDHPLVYSSARLQGLFRDIDARFSENWCAVIVDSVLDRLDLTRFTVANDDQATAALNGIWERTEMNLDADDAHLAALVCGEAYVIGWKDEDGPVECYYNDPRLCHIQYDPAHPRRKLWAAKWWIGEDERYRMTMYYPDRLDYYEAAEKGNPNAASQFRPVEGEETAKNPLGKVPVYHLRLNRRKIKGELSQSIRELQNAANKLVSDLMVAAEYGAFRQRVIISDADVGDLKNAPNEIWALPAGDGVGQDTSVHEFSETALGNYLEAINHVAISMGIISRTPKNLFIRLPTHEISGEALLSMEAPLNSKCARYIQRFVPAWRQVAAFLMELEGMDVDPMAITPLFAKPETVQPRTRAEIRQINTNAGIPLTTTLRDEGRTDAEIEQVWADKRKETVDNANLAQAYLDQARREMDQGAGEEQRG